MIIPVLQYTTHLVNICELKVEEYTKIEEESERGP
jgi:hypothetical protein